MTSQLVQPFGTFSRGKKTAAGATAFAQFIPPFRPQAGAPPYNTNAAKPVRDKGVIHVTTFSYVVPTTAHLITIMRPLNFTTFAADAAAAQAAVVLTADPGSYSTAYNYPLPNGLTVPSTANNLISAGDYVVYQAAAGQWVMDTVASGSTTAPTLTANLPTGGVKQGGLFYYFGISTDTDPCTNEAHEAFDVLAAGSNTAVYTLQDASGLWSTWHEGDPLVFFSSNATTAGFIEKLSGYYSRH